MSLWPRFWPTVYTDVTHWGSIDAVSVCIGASARYTYLWCPWKLLFKEELFAWRESLSVRQLCQRKTTRFYVNFLCVIFFSKFKFARAGYVYVILESSLVSLYVKHQLLSTVQWYFGWTTTKSRQRRWGGYLWVMNSEIHTTPHHGDSHELKQSEGMYEQHRYTVLSVLTRRTSDCWSCLMSWWSTVDCSMPACSWLNSDWARLSTSQLLGIRTRRLNTPCSKKRPPFYFSNNCQKLTDFL